MNQYYSLHSQLGSQEEERALASSISHLSKADPEPLVQFLHITLNSLASLLIRPTVTEESGQCGDIPINATSAYFLYNTVHYTMEC